MIQVENLIRDDPESGIFRVNRAAMTSPEVLALEQTRIFARSWLYVGHESEIPLPGDYRRRMIANRPVFLVRGRDGTPRVFLNTCTHRGAMVCRRDEGNAESFTCFYHGWTFSNRGDLIGVPGQDAYSECFDRGELALRTPPRFESYRGMFFVNFDPEAIPLEEYLGEARTYIDETMDGGEVLGGWALIRGSARYTIHANWKLLVENSMDGYHLPTVHQTYLEYMADRREKAGAGRSKVEQLRDVSRSFALPNGHGGMLSNSPGRPIASPSALWDDSAIEEVQRIRSLLEEKYGEERTHAMASVSRHLSVFPNMAFQDSHTGFRIRQWWPVAPDRMEVTQWEFVPREEREDMRAYRLAGSLAFLGPGGLATPDDVEALESCQLGFNAQETGWSDISRGMHRDEPLASDELQMRAFWRQWHALMSGKPSRQDTRDRVKESSNGHAPLPAGGQARAKQTR